jgi:hypothetical protein
MLCPCCRTELIEDGKAFLESLDEHVCQSEVSLKSKFICPNNSCETFNTIFWNDMGEVYSVDWDAYQKSKSINYIDKNDGPFGSIQRQINIEVDKKDENFILFSCRWFKIEVVYNYTSDKDGNILSRQRTYRIWKKIDDMGYVLYISGVRMFFFTIKSFIRKLRWENRNIKEELTLKDWEKKDWWRVCALPIKKMIYFFHIKNNLTRFDS